MHQLIEDSRIAAEPLVVVSSDVNRAIQEESAGAAVVMLGFQPPVQGSEEDFMNAMNRLCGDLRSVILVSSAGGVALDA